MKFPKHLALLSLTVSMMLAIDINLPVLGALQSKKVLPEVELRGDTLLAQRRRFRFRRRRIRASSRRHIGARRGSCLASNKEVTALLPPDTISSEKEVPREDNIWLTTLAHPTVFFHLPENSVRKAHFVLHEVSKDTDKKVIYKTAYSAIVKLPEPVSPNSLNPPGVISLNLAENEKQTQLPELEIGKSYLWNLMLFCNKDDLSGNPEINGWIKRIDPNTSLKNQLDANSTETDESNTDYILTDRLNESEIRDQPLVYAEAGIWYSALTSLASLHQANPNDLEIKEDWRTLLQEVNNTAIAEDPIIGSATIIKVSLGEFSLD